MRDEGRTLKADLQEWALNHLKLLWPKAKVVSVQGKGMNNISGEDQGDECK